MAGNGKQKQMCIQSVRFGETTWQEIVKESHGQGVSASQYIRESVIARLAWDRSREDGAIVWDAVMAEIRRITVDE